MTTSIAHQLAELFVKAVSLRENSFDFKAAKTWHYGATMRYPDFYGISREAAVAQVCANEPSLIPVLHTLLENRQAMLEWAASLGHHPALSDEAIQYKEYLNQKAKKPRLKV